MGEGGPLPRGRPTQGRADPGREAVFKDQRAAWHWAGMTWGARPRQSQGLGDCRRPPITSCSEEVGKAGLVQGGLRSQIWGVWPRR